jgi:hypothetical protein
MAISLPSSEPDEILTLGRAAGWHGAKRMSGFREGRFKPLKKDRDASVFGLGSTQTCSFDVQGEILGNDRR